MRLFILFIPFLLIYSSASFSQSNNQVKNLAPQQKKLIKKEIRAMSTKDKILSFVIVQEKYAGDFYNRIGGVLLSAPKLNQSVAANASPNLLRLINLTNIKSYHNLPFPSINTRTATKKSLPHWLKRTFGANYYVDLDVTSSQLLYYGLDSTGIYANSTAYHSWDSLLSATLKHDLIYTPLAPELLFNQLAGLKIKSPQRKTLDEKLRTKFIHELNNNNQVEPSSAKEDVLRWIWQTFAGANKINATNGMERSSNLEGINLCSFSFSPKHFNNFSEVLTRYASVPSYSPDQSACKDLVRLAAYDLVIIPVAALGEEEIEFVQKLAMKTKVLMVTFNNEATCFRDVEHIRLVSVPEDNWLSHSLAAQSLFGANMNVDASKRFLYGTPELVNMNPSILKMIDNVVEEAITAQAMPGCQILVAKNGIVVFDQAYGYQTYDSANKVSKTTLYDLASITKVLATTQGIMYLLEHDSISLDAPLSNYLDYLDSTNKKDITIRQIMAHQAGLYPYYPFWKRAKQELKLENGYTKGKVQAGKSTWVSSAVEDSILYWAARSELLAERIDTITHEQYFYSDIGFYLLKDLIEQQTGLPLDWFLRRQLYQPLGTSLVFNPTCFYPVMELAPTENDNLLRHELVQGFVHDRNAALMGGVAGQAGLFGNANDVAIMLQLQLNGGWYGDRRYFDSTTIKQFITRQYDNNRRGLGWDMPGTEPDGPVSDLASDETFGHTGFTGGSIWADPKESLIFVFLSNRIYPSVENTKLIDMNIRTRIQDIVYRAIMK